MHNLNKKRKSSKLSKNAFFGDEDLELNKKHIIDVKTILKANALTTYGVCEDP